jgi:TetR/AcrR family transcriptional repressor of nem operon
MVAVMSPIHRDKPETGCAVAALPTDIARSSQRAQTAYTKQVRRYLDLFAALTPAEPASRPEEYAGPAVFLASASDFMTGHNPEVPSRENPVYMYCTLI